jgi:nitrogenase subunit NifH
MSNFGNNIVRALEKERRAATNKLATILAKQQELRVKASILEAKIKETNDKIINYNNQNI